MSTFDTMAEKIIQEKADVIAQLAWTEAAKVPGLLIDTSNHTVSISDADQKSVLDRLVNRYDLILGPTSRIVSKRSVASMLSSLPNADIPESLR